MSDLLSPLRRAERVLTIRLGFLEKLLPPDGHDHARYAEYLETARVLALVRAQLMRPVQPVHTMPPSFRRRGDAG
jgi:hypothetical protein